MLSLFKRDTPEVEDPAAVEDPELAGAAGVEDPELAGEDPAAGVEDPELAGEDLAATLDATRRRLFTQLVAADGRVRDPETIEYAPELVDDPAALAARITAELETRPGIGRNSAGGDVGAGVTGDPGPADLIDAIRAAHNR